MVAQNDQVDVVCGLDAQGPVENDALGAADGETGDCDRQLTGR